MEGERRLVIIAPAMARKPGKQLRRAATPRVRESVFLNVPYDAEFENLLLAYIVGISAFGFTPRATLEIPFGQRRLDRILSLIRQSRYSIHDLSRVQLDQNAPRTPRFNMPFELGLTVALERSAHPDHSWIVCEAVPHRIKKSLSDLDGTDAYIHGGTVAGVFRELGNAFVGSSRQPTVTEMSQIYRLLRARFRSVLKKAGAKDAFNARVFKELCVRASTAADELAGVS
jgi:hypothetical protein